MNIILNLLFFDSMLLHQTCFTHGIKFRTSNTSRIIRRRTRNIQFIPLFYDEQEKVLAVLLLSSSFVTTIVVLKTMIANIIYFVVHTNFYIRLLLLVLLQASGKFWCATRLALHDRIIKSSYSCSIAK